VGEAQRLHLLDAEVDFRKPGEAHALGLEDADAGELVDVFATEGARQVGPPGIIMSICPQLATPFFAGRVA
jgi:predicted transcriptional regulator